jgi:hypothetical protein
VPIVKADTVACIEIQKYFGDSAQNINPFFGDGAQNINPPRRIRLIAWKEQSSRAVRRSICR